MYSLDKINRFFDRKDILEQINNYVGYDCKDIMGDIYYLAKNNKDYELLALIRDYRKAGGHI